MITISEKDEVLTIKADSSADLVKDRCVGEIGAAFAYLNAFRKLLNGALEAPGNELRSFLLERDIKAIKKAIKASSVYSKQERNFINAVAALCSIKSRVK